MAKRRNAWLTPDDATPLSIVGRCLPIPEPLRPAVVGALAALTEPHNWEQFGTMTPADAAQLATAMLSQFTNDCESSSMLLRQNETTPCILEYSGDNGVSWIPFADLSLCSAPRPETQEYPSDVRLNPVTGELEYSLDGETWYDYPVPTGAEPTNPYTPPREAAQGATLYEKRCMAATRAANNLNQMYKQTYGAIAAGVANSWGSFMNFMNDVTEFVFGVTYGAYWDIVKLIGLWEPIDYETAYAAPELSTQALNDLTCLLFENASVSDGIVTFNFGAVRDNVISDLGINPGTAVWTHLNYLSESGLNRLADVGFGSSECVECAALAWIELDLSTYDVSACDVECVIGDNVNSGESVYTIDGAIGDPAPSIRGAKSLNRHSSDNYADAWRQSVGMWYYTDLTYAEGYRFKLYANESVARYSVRVTLYGDDDQILYNQQLASSAAMTGNWITYSNQSLSGMTVKSMQIRVNARVASQSVLNSLPRIYLSAPALWGAL